MSTLSELQKKLQQESQGIMFPFSAATNAVDTTQQVYDSSTDGIMTMTGKKYVGPDAVIQYGTEEEGFPRQLKQIEAPMLPQVSNLPPTGTGIMELAPGASTPEPISTDPVVEQPAVDPCPPGYQLINGVCQLIQTRDDNKGNLKSKTLEEKGYTKVLDKFTGSSQAGGINSIKMQQLENKYGANIASLIGTTSQQTGFDGAHIKELTQTEIDRLNNLGKNSGIDGIPGTPIYKDGVLINKETGTGKYKVVGNPTSIQDVLKDLTLIPDVLKNIFNSISGKEKATEIINKKISPELQAQYKSSVVETKDTPTETKIAMAPELVSLNFGNFGIDTVDFGNLPRIGIEVGSKLNALNNVLKNNRDLRNNKVYSDRKKKLEKKQKDILKANKENEAMDKFIQKNGEDKFAQEVDKKYATSNYTSPVKDAANRWDKNNKQGKSTGYTNIKTNKFVKETKAQHVKRAARNAAEDPSRRGGRNSY